MSSTIRVAVVGVGAVGGTVAASFLEAGVPVQLCLRTPFSRLVIEHENAGTKAFAPLDRWHHPEEAIPCDVVFVATKAHQTAGLAAWLRKLVGNETVVVVLQNGVEHQERMVSWVPPETTVIPVIVDCPSTRQGPGHVILRRNAQLLLPDNPASYGVLKLFANTAPLVQCAISGDFQTALWRKLCVNVISGSIPALTGQTAGVFRFPSIQSIAEKIVREAWMVAIAEGATLEESVISELVESFARAPINTRNAMLQDREKGALLEADARHGAVVRFGHKHGIPTPYNELLHALLGAVNQPLGTDS